MASALDLGEYAAGLLVLVGATLLLSRLAGIGLGFSPLWVAVRAAVQLTVVALLLRGALTSVWAVAGFVVLMLSTATWTSGRRLRALHQGWRAAVAGLLAGAAISILLIFALQLVQLELRYVIAVAGIIIGNAMNAVTLSGRNFMRSARQRRDEIEAWLALGATPSQAHLEIGQEAVRESLLPNLDQTRATGLVTLPGAFVGALFGGASPAAAARFQLVVLLGVGLAMTAAGIIVTRLLGRSPYVVPVER